MCDLSNAYKGKIVGTELADVSVNKYALCVLSLVGTIVFSAGL